MDISSQKAFLDLWHDIMLMGSILMIALSLITFLIYQLKVSSISDLKIKHDFINASEIKWLKWVFHFLGAAAALAINLYGRDEMTSTSVAFFVRLFFSVSGATLIGYIAALILDYYYPTRLSRKLRKLRYTPRISSTGNKMKLLTEDEEDVHLDEGMKAEENTFQSIMMFGLMKRQRKLKLKNIRGI